jgi:phosphoglycolate phosphatase-like HAD superfamily hydrolase
MNDLKAIIYDFDGVICDSVDVKTAAFASLYESFGEEVVEQVKTYHLAHGGVSRYKKIRYFHEVLLKKELNSDQLNSLAQDFSRLVLDKVINSPYIEGALEYLEKNHGRYKQFICTGTPESEMKYILKKKGISHLFDGVYGAPEAKVRILGQILSKFDYHANHCVFIGDAMTDFEAAAPLNIPFWGIINQRTQFPPGTTIFDDFRDNKLYITL